MKRDYFFLKKSFTLDVEVKDNNLSLKIPQNIDISDLEVLFTENMERMLNVEFYTPLVEFSFFITSEGLLSVHDILAQVIGMIVTTAVYEDSVGSIK